MGEGEDITKEQLKKEIQDILKDADLDNTSAKKVILLTDLSDIKLLQRIYYRNHLFFSKKLTSWLKILISGSYAASGEAGL